MNIQNEKLNRILKAAVLAVIVVIISWPVLFMDLAKGHDLLFHLERIEGIRMDASWTNLPVRMQSGWMGDYGYPVSILYGDLFLYIGAVFRKLGFAVIPAFRLFMLCVNTATVVISYYSFKVFNKGWTPVIAAGVYATSSYRLVDVYVRSAIGETLAITFFPAVAACIYLILTTEDARQRLKYSILLSFSFLAVICSHTLTTSMMIVVLILFGPAALILFGIKGKKIRQMGNIAFSGVLTVLLAAFFIIPFLDFYLFADIAFALKGKNSIQGEGPSVADLFDFICNPFGGISGGNIQRTPGPVLMFVLIAALIYCIISAVKKIKLANHRRIVFETVASLILIFMSSAYFPWNFIEDNVPVLGGILTAIEFPMRYLAFAIVFMSLLTGDMINGIYILISENRPAAVKTGTAICTAIIGILCVLSVIQVCYWSTLYDKRADYETPEDLGEWCYYAMDFRLENTTVDDLPKGLVYENLVNMEVLSRNSNDFLIACTSGPDYGWIQLPVFNYKYYHATDVEDTSREFEIHDGGNRTVGVLLPGNYSGIVHVFWREPVSWRIAEAVSLVTFIGCVIFLIINRKKEVKERS
ncbi:MAG: hypothetical protein K6E49_08570 [Lachnospiraceae bacterium]|nr:hypothetical protein [Lachnospiraceae bacterium]